jgi:hypothetical protein
MRSLVKQPKKINLAVIKIQVKYGKKSNMDNSRRMGENDNYFTPAEHYEKTCTVHAYYPSQITSIMFIQLTENSTSSDHS